MANHGHIQLAIIPNEVLEYILQCEVLTFKDVLNFGMSCTQSWQVVFQNNQVWKYKFNQRWPHLLNHEEFVNYTTSNWMEECRIRKLIGYQTMQIVSSMSARHIQNEELSSSDFKSFVDILNNSCIEQPQVLPQHKQALNYMIDELMLCIHHKDRSSNLTRKYYSKTVLRHLRQLSLKKKWDEFKFAPAEHQLLEHGAVIVAQWSQPTEEITYTSIGVKLDSIADEVCKQLRLEYGDNHLALCVSSEEREYWRDHNIADNHYSPNVSRQVIQAVSTVLFEHMGYYGNSELYYSHENSYINKVLEYGRGIPITLSIVFEAVTRRLGVKCEPVSFPGHFLLRWRDSYKEDVPTPYHYIDVFNGGVFIGKNSCPQFANAPGRCPMGEIFRFGPATALQVVERMANNLEVAGRQRTSMNGRATRLRSALELLHMVNPSNLNCLLQMARFYMQYNMDVSYLRQTIQSLNNIDLRLMGQISSVLRTLSEYDKHFCQSSQSSQGLKVKIRTGLDVLYAVGMVMHHRQFDYTCVIIGWDPRCKASDEWVLQMNVRSLSRQTQQPFYQVLVSDGTNRYAAEENLELETGQNCWVTHSEVGRYFDQFADRRYLPNAELQSVYPDDLAVAEAALGPRPQ